MYITQLDELFDNIINSFYNFLNEKKAFNIFRKDLNFVSIQNYIIDLIKEFTTKKIKEDDILKIIKNKNNFKFVFEIIKRYCAYYVYLSIAYLIFLSLFNVFKLICVLSNIDKEMTLSLSLN